MADGHLVSPSVAATQALVGVLDEAGLKPRAVFWMWREETQSWRLWIVPRADLTDRMDFYGQIARLMETPAWRETGVDGFDVQFATDSDPYVVGLGKLTQEPGVGYSHPTPALLDGLYIPDSIVIRMAV